MLTYSLRTWPRWCVPFSKPLDLYVVTAHTLRRQRRIHLSPVIYAATGLAGAAAGLLLRRRLRRGSWALAAVLPAGAWAASTLTAFTKGEASESLQEVRKAALQVLNPRQALERLHREQEAQFRSSPLPLYGLPPSWQGMRTIGGWSRSGREIVEMGLLHGDLHDEGSPELRVDVSKLNELERYGDRRHLEESLARELGRIVRLAGLVTSQELSDHQQRVRAMTVASLQAEQNATASEEPRWETVRIPVDGDPVDFAWLAEADHWVAHAERQDVRLTLRGRRLPIEQVELVRVLDVGPYVEGSRRLFETAWGQGSDS
jgi:hypothetical protein